jgi:DNA replication and repair protein RecF
MIKRINISNFRNFKEKEFEFTDGITLILGPNASGKTNVLESLFLLSTSKSFKAKLESEMISYNSDIARITGITSGERLEAILTRGLIDIGADHPEKVARKKLLVNGVPKRMIDFAGNFKTVLFGSWDLDLVTGSPSIRRKFLDTVLSQADREYRRSVLSYEKGLRQRNRVLWDMREGNVGADRLLFWNQLLIKNGDYISQKREEFIDFANSTSNTGNPINANYQLEYDRSIISQGRLEQYKDEEVAAATTLVGPHRDDFVFKISNAKKANDKFENRELAAYGSRGEQRMGVLWLKMAELAFIEEKSGERPTLLLDDIFSELDGKHREVVMDIAQKQQTIITAIDDIFAKDLKKIIKIALGE